MRVARPICLLALLLGLAACGEDEPSASATTTAVATTAVATTEAVAPLRLLAVGDSITAGPYYRAPLQERLAEDRCRVDFVGSATDEQPDQPGLTDPDHEGHGGWQAAQLAEQARAWAEAAEPDVILLYAGVNDFYAGADVATVTASVTRTVEELQAGAPDAQLLLAQIMPAVGLEAQIMELNDALGALEGDQVTVVDLHDGFDHATDTSDGVHPNAEAAARLADGWFGALGPFVAPVCGG